MREAFLREAEMARLHDYAIQQQYLYRENFNKANDAELEEMENRQRELKQRHYQSQNPNNLKSGSQLYRPYGSHPE